MKINLIAIGAKMPYWINEGFRAYAKRLPPDFRLNLIEIPAGKRLKKADLNRLQEEESNALLNAIPKNSLAIAFDRMGEELSTTTLAKQLIQWHQDNQSIALLIGGPEGLSQTCLQQAARVWSLSKLTLPHPLVRVLIAEQIYRAWSIMMQHPYHR